MAYQIVGTKVPYTGKVIKIGESFYTTSGGGIEGDRQQIERTTTDSTINDNSINQTNDIITKFTVGDTSLYGGNTYYYSDGSVVNDRTELHHHTLPQVGRSNFMTQHTMDGNERDVYLTRQDNGDRSRRTIIPTTPADGGARNGMRRTPGNMSNEGNQGGGGTY